MNIVILLIFQILFGLFFCFLFYFENSKITIPSVSYQEMTFIHYHYCKKLHYKVYENKTTTVWIYFAVFFVFSLLTVLNFGFSIFYLIISLIFIFSEFKKIKTAKKQASTPSFLKKVNMLDRDDISFQSSLFEKNEHYKDDYGSYALIDPNIFQLSSIYKISFQNFLYYLVSFIIYVIFTIVIFVIKEVIT